MRRGFVSSSSLVVTRVDGALGKRFFSVVIWVTSKDSLKYSGFRGLGRSLKASETMLRVKPERKGYNREGKLSEVEVYRV